MNKAPLRIDIELVHRMIDVRLRMTDEEKDAAMRACPELPRVLNDAMSNVRRRYTGDKIPTRGEPAKRKMVEVAARLRERIETDERAAGLSVEVQAYYQEQVVETRSVRA